MTLSPELQPVNEPAAFEFDARSDIRIDLEGESLIGAWATFFGKRSLDLADSSEPNPVSATTTKKTDPHANRNLDPPRHPHVAPPSQGDATRAPPAVRLDKGLPIGATLPRSLPS